MVFAGIHNPNRVRNTGYRVRQRPTGGWSASSPVSTVGPHRSSWGSFYNGLYGGVSYINRSIGGGGLARIARGTYDPYSFHVVLTHIQDLEFLVLLVLVLEILVIE